MIKERYVNFEVARLLKDKGFDEECFAKYANESCTEKYYDDYRERMMSWEIKSGELIIPLIDRDKYDIYGDTIPAPTQQMACDWVRIKEVLITYDLAPLGAKVIMVKVYKRVYDDPNYDWTEGITIIRSTLEEAINEALKYALEKLL